jgi:hypothetical protein
MDVAGERIGVAPGSHAPEERVKHGASGRCRAVGHAGKPRRRVAEQDALGLDDRAERADCQVGMTSVISATSKPSSWKQGRSVNMSSIFQTGEM